VHLFKNAFVCGTYFASATLTNPLNMGRISPDPRPVAKVLQFNLIVFSLSYLLRFMTLFDLLFFVLLVKFTKVHASCSVSVIGHYCAHS